MIKISLCLIVKDEELVLDRCLSCFKDIVDEIIIVDTGSTDNTVEIAKKYTNKVYFFKWVDDFSKARNYSFSKASKEYIMWIDADEIITDKDRELLIDLKNNISDEYDSITMKTNMGDNQNLVFRRHRIVKRANKYKWIGFIHEYLNVAGYSYDSDIEVTQAKVKSSGTRNLDIYKKKLQEGEEFSARDICYYGRELYYNNHTDEAIQVLTKFLETDGWVEDKIDVICKIADCYIQKGQVEEANKVLFSAFEISSPRGEIIYRLGLNYQSQQKYENAIYWYESILNLNKPTNNYGFVYNKYWDIYPMINLCICYYEIGLLDKSYYYHSQSREIDSTDEYVVSNEEFFNDLKKENKINIQN